MQLEFRSRIVEMDADERDGAAQPTSGGLVKQKKKPTLFHNFPGIFREKTIEKIQFRPLANVEICFQAYQSEEGQSHRTLMEMLGPQLEA